MCCDCVRLTVPAERRPVVGRPVKRQLRNRGDVSTGKLRDIFPRPKLASSFLWLSFPSPRHVGRRRGQRDGRGRSGRVTGAFPKAPDSSCMSTGVSHDVGTGDGRQRPRKEYVVTAVW